MKVAETLCTKSAGIADLPRRINDAHDRAVEHASRALSYAVETGALLEKAKAALPNGQWLPWLRKHIHFSERTAQAYMRICKHQGALGAETNITKALEKIANPLLRWRADEVAELLHRHAEQRRASPADVSQWTLDDAIACAGRIRALDRFVPDLDQ